MSRRDMTRYQKMEGQTLGDEQGKIKVKALLNALIDTQEAIKAN